MKIDLCYLLVLVIFSIGASSAKDDERGGMRGEMVAFSCGRPSVHMSTEGEWVRDQSTDCLKDAADILDFCRKVYSNYEVWNVVESGKNYVIKEWCNFGKTTCQDEIVVRPYRCLVGSFESEALQVPESCRFDLVHDSTDCKSYSAWNTSTTGLCRHKRMQLHSFSILQPCDVDGFAGAEFVCCPTGKKIEEKKEETQRNIPMGKQALLKQTAVPSHVAEDDAYKTYLRQSHDPNLSEHEYFLKAKTELDKQHSQRVDKIMREWASARKQVLEIKKGDSKGGEKFNREMTARFQKAYESLEREDAERKKQLLELHDQRVNIDTNQKKRVAMDAYMTAIKAENPESSAILKSLMQYIKVEQKDRLHSISHYKHVQRSDPVEAEAMRSMVADRLRSIDERVTQATNMLAQVPKFEKKIRNHIEKFLSQYDSFDESLSVIMAKMDESSDGSRDQYKHIRHTVAPFTTPDTTTTPMPTTTTTNAAYREYDGDDLDDYDYEDGDDDEDDDEDDDDDVVKHVKKFTEKVLSTQKNLKISKSVDSDIKKKLSKNKKANKSEDKVWLKKPISSKVVDESYDEDEEEDDIEDYVDSKIIRNRNDNEETKRAGEDHLKANKKITSKDLVEKEQGKVQIKNVNKKVQAKEFSRDSNTGASKQIKIEDEDTDAGEYSEDEMEFKLKLAPKDVEATGSVLATKKPKAIYSSAKSASTTKTATDKHLPVEMIARNEEAANHQHIIANNAKSEFAVEQSFYKKSLPKGSAPSSRMVAPVAIMIAVAAIFVGAIVGVIVLRTRQTDEPNHNIMAVDDRQQCTNVKVEARKINGYENPTYHFYNKLAANIKNIDDDVDDDVTEADKIDDA